MNVTAAQVIIKALESWGVRNIYGVSGDAILPFMDALGKQDKVRYYSPVTEQGAAFMACGEARVTGKPGVCLATEGPGALNLINGVADAYRDGVPMLVITGQVETGKISTNAKQYFDQQQVFGPVTGFSTLLNRPESAVDNFKIAMEKAIGDNTPCHISVPKDIFSALVGEYDIPPLGNHTPPGIFGNTDEVISLLMGCRKPLIIAGRAAIPHRDAVYRLAKLVGAAVIPAQGAGGIYAGEECFFVGGLGEAHIPPVLNRTDCIILIGASPYEHKFIPKSKKIIQIDTRPQNLANHLRPLPLTGNMALILDLITGGLGNYVPDPGWQDEISKCHYKHLKMIEKETELRDKPVSPRQVVALLNETIPDASVITIDSGEFMHWFDRGFIPRKQKVIMSDYWRSMGCGLLYALGVKAACPDQKVVVLSGEGGFMMSIQELITAARYALPVTIIVFNNGRYLLEEHRMLKNGMDPFGVDVRTANFTQFAAACGIEGIRVEEPAELRGALERAMTIEGPAVVDISTNQEKPLFI